MRGVILVAFVLICSPGWIWQKPAPRPNPSRSFI